MILLLGLLIPIAFTLIIILRFKDRAIWWEYVILFGSYFLFIGAFYISARMVASATNDVEYHTDYIVALEYYEDWDEYIHKTCTSTDSDGNVTVYDCSYVDYHPEYYTATLSSGRVHYVSKDFYDRTLGFLGGSPTFVDQDRDYYENDGDLWENKYPDGGKIWPVTYDNYYGNLVKANQHSVFHFKDIDQDEAKSLGLYDYPSIDEYGIQRTVLGGYSSDANAADYNIRRTNAILGPRLKVQTYVLIFKNKPMSIAFEQESYWQGGNRNEFVICIGIDDQRIVKWSKILSWTPNQSLKMKVRDSVLAMHELRLADLSLYVHEELAENWIQMDFKEFDYLQYKLSTFSIIIIFILTIASNFGVFMWVVGNDW